MSVGSSAQRRTEAETAIALVDGLLLLLRQLAGPDSADRAARRLGIRQRQRLAESNRAGLSPGSLSG